MVRKEEEDIMNLGARMSRSSEKGIDQKFYRTVNSSTVFAMIEHQHLGPMQHLSMLSLSASEGGH